MREITNGMLETTRRILVLADTHNHLPSNLHALAEGMDEIWHLGDVCRKDVLDQLRLVGPPVMLVRGNCDSNFEWLLVLNLTRNGIRFRLQHIPPPARRPPDNCDVLLHGHTHVPRDETIGSIRFLNPGCVTRPNRGAPASLAFLEIKPAGELDWRLVRLR
jgi:putative phosphoesterase